MRTFVSGLLVVVLALTLGLGVYAQDTAAQEGDITCDADLMLNLYVANRFFGFNQFQTRLGERGVDPSLMVDVNRFNRGQFGTLFQGFEAMHGTGATGEQAGQTGDAAQATPEGGEQAGQETPQPEGAVTSRFGVFDLNDEQANRIVDILAMDEATFQTEFRNRVPQAEGADPAADLVPGAMAGEAPECAQLRSALHRFWSALAIEDFSTGMTMGLNQGQLSGTGEAGDTSGEGSGG